MYLRKLNYEYEYEFKHYFTIKNDMIKHTNYLLKLKVTNIVNFLKKVSFNFICIFCRYG